MNAVSSNEMIAAHMKINCARGNKCTMGHSSRFGAVEIGEILYTYNTLMKELY